MSTTSDDPSHAELLYTALREETLKRLEIRHQFIAAILTLVGIMFGFGVTTSAVAFLYPPISLVLATGWVHNELRMKQIGIYLRDNIEPTLRIMGWEHFRQRSDHEIQIGIWPLNLLSTDVVFLVTQLIAICLGAFNFKFNSTEWFLLVIGALSVVLMCILLWDYKRRNRLYMISSSRG